jgi:NADH-quinone oxidoreductase subunit E
MMQMMTFDAAALLPQKDETLMEYWLSFAPIAPLMGVAYRPAKMWGYESDAPAVSAPMPAATTRVKDPVEEAEVVAKDVAAAAQAAPAEEPTPAPAPTAEDSDLTRIKGIGAKLQAELNTLGLFTVAQLADYTDAQIAMLSEGMSSFKDRPIRDAWVAQAKDLIG